MSRLRGRLPNGLPPGGLARPVGLTLPGDWPLAPSPTPREAAIYLSSALAKADAGPVPVAIPSGDANSSWMMPRLIAPGETPDGSGEDKDTPSLECEPCARRASWRPFDRALRCGPRRELPPALARVEVDPGTSGDAAAVRRLGASDLRTALIFLNRTEDEGSCWFTVVLGAFAGGAESLARSAPRAGARRCTFCLGSLVYFDPILFAFWFLPSLNCDPHLM